ncbi:MAG TPA: transporter, partial [Flavobacteriaceae bacterium]|nr:transporter [Flavobacteriaceae bacterium]
QAIKGDLYSDDIFRAGAAYLINQDFQVHASGLMNFKDTPSKWQVAVGVSYRLDMHSYDEYVIPKEDKEKQKEEEEMEKNLKEKQEEFDEATPKK